MKTGDSMTEKLARPLPRRRTIAAVAGGLMALLATPVLAQSSGNRAQIGVLRCDVSGGIGLIVTSSRTMDCEFERANGPDQRYTGRIQRFGLDIGATAGGVMIWNVFATGRDVPRGALSGEYVGAGGEATVGVGVGANALVGGSNNTISLQPVSLQAQAGLNFATGVTRMTLN